MVWIEAVAREGKVTKEELKAKMQAGEAQVLAKMEYVRAFVDHLGISTPIFRLGGYDLDPEPIDPIPDPTAATSHSNEKVGPPWF